MKGNLDFPINATSAEKKIMAQLHRLVGAKLKVQTREVKADELSLDFGDAVYVRFMNRGQLPVMIDNQIILQTGEVYVEGDSAGPGIDHVYRLEFQPQPKNGTPLAGVDKPYVYAGAHVSIRSFHRKY
ncbi:MAG: hypothetical protein AAGA31_04270 [Bacteroidota bacterium]